VPLIAWGLFAVAGLCLLQLLPLPGALLGALSPEAAEVRDFALLPLGLSRARCVSLDPPATWRALSMQLGSAAVLLSAAQLSRSRRARRRLVAAVALCGAALAALGFAHQLFGLKSLFGVYAFVRANPPLLTPFGNANHLAGYLLLAALLSLGLSVSAERRPEALLWGLGFLVTGAAQLASLSRGGIFFFAVAALLFGGMLLLSRGKEASAARLAQVMQVGVALAGVVALGAYVALDGLMGELATADSLEKLRASKLELWPMMGDAALHFWRAGMGRGAFEAAFSRFQTVLPGYTLTHPENAVLQLGAELGLLGALLVLGLFGAGFLRLIRRSELSRLDLALLAGAVGLCLHNLVDFNLEFPACASALCVALGVLARPGERDEAQAGVRLGPRLALPVAAAVLGLSLLALVPGRHTLLASEEQLAALAQANAPAAKVRQEALKLIDLHPADYLPYAAAGRALSQAGGDPGEALAFVNRALFLRPLDADSHRTAARALLRLGKRNQAFAEYQRAVQGEEGTRVLSEAAKRARGLEELERLTPPEPRRVCEVAEQLWGWKRGDEAVGLLEWGAQEAGSGPEAPQVWLLLAQLRTARREFEQALAAVERAERQWPEAPEPVKVKAETLAAMGKPAEAAALLEARVVHQPGNVELSFALAEQQLALGDPRRALDVLARANPFVASPSQRSVLMVLQGRSFEAMGRAAKALDAYQSAARLSPEGPALHYTIARVYEGMGKAGEAAREVREGMHRDSPEGVQTAKAWLSRLEAEEKKVEPDPRKSRVLNDEERLDLELLHQVSGNGPR